MQHKAANSKPLFVQLVCYRIDDSTKGTCLVSTHEAIAAQVVEAAFHFAFGSLGTRFKPCSPQINFYNAQAIEPVGLDDHQSNRGLPGLFAGANVLVRLKDRPRLQYCFFRLNRWSGLVIKLWLQVCKLAYFTAFCRRTKKDHGVYLCCGRISK
jgi:hypothetical protein